jgi:carboxypeptidase Q
MMKLLTFRATTITLILGLMFSATFAQNTAEINDKIRKEGMENSQIMRTMHYFTDVYGPRLTGSPNLKMAGSWAVKTMKDWKFDNAYLEEWDFGHPGWANERASGFIVSPVKDSLVFEVLAWTPSTKGTVSGEAFLLKIPKTPSKEYADVMQNPTKEELTAYLDSVKNDVKGKMVLIDDPDSPGVDFNEPDKRFDDGDLEKYFDPNNKDRNAIFRRRFPEMNRKPPTPKKDALNGREINEMIDAFLLENGAAVRINDAGRLHGQIRAFNNRTFDVTKVVPTVVMRNEDYGRIWRISEDKTPVKLEFDIRNQNYPEGKTSYNVIGEIKGSEKPDEVIMLGGHLDSWHAATGATDNAIGCAIMMEAARIIKTLNLKPKRTIRVALWSGEEQGLLGSQAYVAKHFGTAENPLPEYSKFGGYFNIDSGTGKARGLTVFGTSDTATILREIVAPFKDYGIYGALDTDSRRTGGSDHTSFNAAGLPGIGVLQDPIEYGSHTWHTNLDTYERIVEDDVKKSAVIVAAAVYQLAMRDELLPRFDKDKMPKIER